MNEHRDVSAEEARRAGLEAVGHELTPDHNLPMVTITVYVNGRSIQTVTDGATVARIMAILTGLGE